MNGCGLPNDDSYYEHPTHQEKTMNQIPTTTDLLNATDKDGWTLAERIESSLNTVLHTFLDPEQLDVTALAGDLTDTILQDLKDTDLNAYAHQQEA